MKKYLIINIILISLILVLSIIFFSLFLYYKMLPLGEDNINLRISLRYKLVLFLISNTFLLLFYPIINSFVLYKRIKSNNLNYFILNLIYFISMIFSIIMLILYLNQINNIALLILWIISSLSSLSLIIYFSIKRIKK